MVCRASRLSSAMVTFARDMSGLEDSQVLGLNHALMQEGANTSAPTVEQWNALITDVQNRYRAGLLTTSPGSHDPISRLEASRTELPNAQRYYAVQRLLERSQSAASSQRNFFTNWARNLGTSVQSAEAEYWQGFREASDNSRLCATPQFVEAFSANPDNANLAVDRRSLYAYQQMALAQTASLSRRETQPAVTSTWQFEENPDRPGRGYISGIGYDPETGHTEISWSRGAESGLTHCYRGLDAQQIENLIASDNREELFRQTISGQSDYRYNTREEAEAARLRLRCATCGQFAASSHACPVNGSEEALNRDTRLAVARARAEAMGLPLEENTPLSRMADNGTMRYEAGEGVSMRLPGVSRIMSEARSNGSVLVPIHAIVSEPVTDDEGNTFNAANSVNGFARIDYNGRGNGYTVTAVAEPGDSGNDRLRCDCIQYRTNLTCQHLEVAVAGITGLTNPNRPSRETVAEARATVTESLTQEYNASVASTTAAAAGFTPLSVSLETNNEKFQDLYDEYRDKRTAYQTAIASGEAAEYPVPYVRENAFGGLGTRASQRGFGVELEFAFPQDMSSGDRRIALRAIGRELHDLGLTRNRDQAGYGASHGWFRDTHDRGWSFESDPSTGGSDGQHGGEIVSPVMYDEPETWTNIEKICNILRTNGAFASKGVGMHVHVSTGDYDHRVENHNRLIQSFSENEDLLYRMSTSPERGRHRGTGYCSPNNIPTSPYTNVGQARDRNVGHHIGLNLQSVSGRGSDHVEFRTFDGTLEPAVIQAQAAIAVMVTEGATRGDAPTNLAATRNPLGARLEANPQRGVLTGDAWKESTLGFRRFVDKHVPDNGSAPQDNPIVRQMVALFAMTKWQKGRRR